MALVLVTDGEHRASLAIVRSLGRAGHEVIVTSASGRSMAGASRHAGAEVKVPSALGRPEGFADALIGLTRAHGADVILPVSDAAVLALLPRRSECAPAVVPWPDLEIFQRVSDKGWAASAAARAGIAVPTQTIVARPDDLGSLPGRAPRSLVLKPARSVRHGRALGVSFASVGDDLHAAIRGQPDAAFPLLVQERVTGEGRGVFLLRWGGRTVAAFAHRRLREKPPAGGVSVLCESVPLPADLQARAEAILDSAGWRGVAMLELKQPSADGPPYMIEINGRFWGSLQLAIDAGVDFPRILVDLALGNDPGPPPPYRVGARSRWLLGDLDHLLLRLTRSDRALALPEGSPGRARALARFIGGFVPPGRGEVFRLADPHPSIREAAAWLGALRRPRASR